MKNFPSYINKIKLQNFIKLALDEDIGSGDYSTLATIDKKLIGEANLLIKENCIIAGVELAIYIYSFFDKNIKIKKIKSDGEFCKTGEIAFKIYGKIQSILSTERLILNCMQRMSGIATFTNSIIKKINNKVILLDSRKTTPNFRMLEKWAVKIGGGSNHRIGLYDMILLKDNHHDYNGSITKSVLMTVKYLKTKKLNLKIEVETRNLKEVEEALNTKYVDRIMLDNMDIETIKKAVQLINGRCEIEASGEISENNFESIINTGIDFISIGKLTHSVKNINLSLKAIEKTS